jgi:molybdopterin/thiamine biosynthesis adenylyltransferase
MRLSEEPQEREERPAKRSEKLPTQVQLRMSKVLVLGLSWSGMEVCRHLITAGIGRLVITDGNAQLLATAQNSLMQYQQAVGSKSELVAKNLLFSASSGERLIDEADLVIDAQEDWQHKLMASDLCMHLGKSLIHAGGTGMRFQIYVMRPGRSACLRCAFPLAGIDDIPLTPNKDEQFDPIVAVVGAMQAFEAIKLLTRLGVSQGNELLKYDGLSGEFEIIRGLDPREDCPDCGRLRTQRR